MLRLYAAAAAMLVGCNAFAQDLTSGKAHYEACAPCHGTGPMSTELGPTLIGIIGRAAGSREDFRYSRALRAAKIVWDEPSLDAFLADPQAFIGGTRMPFAGMPDKAERTNLIAYLRTLR
jgi:cytochrome c